MGKVQIRKCILLFHIRTIVSHVTVSAKALHVNIEILAYLSSLKSHSQLQLTQYSQLQLLLQFLLINGYIIQLSQLYSYNTDIARCFTSSLVQQLQCKICKHEQFTQRQAHSYKQLQSFFQNQISYVASSIKQLPKSGKLLLELHVSPNYQEAFILLQIRADIASYIG